MQPLTEDERLLLTHDTMQLLDDWGLQAREIPQRRGIRRGERY